MHPTTPRDLHDGSWAMRRRPASKRVDWDNEHRTRTIALFGKRFYVDRLRARIRALFPGTGDGRP